MIDLKTGEIRDSFVRLLSRPYASRVGGVLESQYFNMKNGKFELQFKCSAGLVTQIRLVKRVHYPKGFSIVVADNVFVKIVHDNLIEISTEKDMYVYLALVRRL